MQGADSIDVIRQMLDAWNRKDLADSLALLDPEIEYVNSPNAVEPGTLRGSEHATAVLEAQWEILLDAQQGIDRIFDRGDDIVTLGRISRRMPGSDATLEEPVLTAWRTHEGKITRVEILGFGGTEVQEALKAAGLE